MNKYEDMPVAMKTIVIGIFVINKVNEIR